MIGRLRIGALLFVAVLVQGCSREGAVREEAVRGDVQGPSVVLITLDTVRADFLSSYGYEPGHTPHLDALAAGGIRFETAFSSSAVTPVSHASILTGNFQYRHGLRVLSADGGFRLSEDSVSLASSMKAAGYRTGAVHSAFPVSSWFGFDRDFDHFDSFDASMDERGEADGSRSTSWSVKDLQRRSDETTDRALDFVRAGDGPFFLWIHYWDPHDPQLMPPDDFMAKVDPNKKWKNAGKEEIYAAELKYLDSQLGRFFAGLEESGLASETIVALTADHGQGLDDGYRDHRWMLHRMLYQEQLHVPLILRIPGARTGVVAPGVVRTVDVVPTLLDYVGLEIASGLDGRSLRPLIEGALDEPRVAYADQINGYDFNATAIRKFRGAEFMYCIVKGDWKLVFRPHLPEMNELFHLRDDPDEVDNRFDREPEVARELIQDLARRNPWVLAPFSPDAASGSEASGVLEALGYQGGDGASDVDWTWTCPIHRDFVSETRSRHDDCGSILVPARVE